MQIPTQKSQSRRSAFAPNSPRIRCAFVHRIREPSQLPIQRTSLGFRHETLEIMTIIWDKHEINMNLPTGAGFPHHLQE